MGVTISGNVQSVSNFEHNGMQINIYSSPKDYELIYNDLEKLKSIANDEQKRDILDAQQCITAKNENKLIEALKKLKPFIGRVASSVTASVIVAYMKEKGIML